MIRSVPAPEKQIELNELAFLFFYFTHTAPVGSRAPCRARGARVSDDNVLKYHQTA